MALRSLRKKRRPGNRPMTTAQLEHVHEAKRECMPCVVWASKGNMPEEHIAVCCDYNHVLSGSVRKGHDHGYGGCLWHHRGRIEVDGWTHAAMRAHFGPSLAEGSRPYFAAYGSHEELRQLQLERMSKCP